ncbi:hypothetical protein C0995_012777 [Termitomyces sp. Mi166|nr:hypothetical protein C0995_012777 [Termitomyces sp. Mi166\
MSTSIADTQPLADTQPHTDAQPPSFQSVNSIELVSTENSKITAVSVYSGRAEITRVFNFEVKTGQNQVTIDGLPNVLDQDSLRVEGRGAATIHDVTVSNINPQQTPETSSTITELTSKKEKTTKALERCRKAISSLESYLGTMDVKTIDVGQVRQVVKEYDTTAEELDNRVLELEGQLKEIQKELEKERASLNSGPKPNDELRKRAVIGVFADVEGEVEIILVYAVHRASWTAGYDVRVNTHTYEEPVTLIYKASITQKTGEDWTDIPLTLETATPTFGINVPKLDSWNLSIYKPIPRPPPVPILAVPAQLRMKTPVLASVMSRDSEFDDVEGDEMSHRGFDVVTSKGKGNVSATFQVPGLITIPSDGAAHNVTIVKLSLGAVMSWVCVPKKDVKTHLSAKIKNASQYTLLRGKGSIYVDGSFISRSDVPAVSPEESFDCPLGLDPSIRITYHPLSKKQSESGFYSKTTTHVYTQTITVHNTKSTAVERVRISDQIPVSEDAQIQVKLLSPALPLPLALTHNAKDKDKVQDKDQRAEKTKRVAVSRGVSAMWEGADESEDGGEVVGRNGKFCWVVGLPGQAKVNLVLQYEVVVPAGTNVVGLA